MIAITFLQVESALAQRALDEIAGFEQIKETYSIVGRWDAVVLVSAPNLDALERLVRDTIGTVKGVQRTETHIVNQVVSSKIWEGMFDLD